MVGELSPESIPEVAGKVVMLLLNAALVLATLNSALGAPGQMQNPPSEEIADAFKRQKILDEFATVFRKSADSVLFQIGETGGYPGDFKIGGGANPEIALEVRSAYQSCVRQGVTELLGNYAGIAAAETSSNDLRLLVPFYSIPEPTRLKDLFREPKDEAGAEEIAELDRLGAAEAAKTFRARFRRAADKHEEKLAALLAKCRADRSRSMEREGLRRKFEEQTASGRGNNPDEPGEPPALPPANWRSGSDSM